MSFQIGEIRLSEPKNLGGCVDVYRVFGLQVPGDLLDESISPNAIRLVELNNQACTLAETVTALAKALAVLGEGKE